jgi:hypothetical protein
MQVLGWIGQTSFRAMIGFYALAGCMLFILAAHFSQRMRNVNSGGDDGISKGSRGI